ncbi:hypothetical protein SMACR_01670 [Sordaria macrospora]|uniref:WGS project CABT00000000 data, contig 2.5 n=2 Tax=Sordaria macrospora TaxID=5147 RepID=F7VRI5_SORMK|nr:uncharacterized protein SMAC_01670 [Sordaria macrospora k-hell]KAA8635924.1 hypothetical protein SMACR_01670 [Sordaria macrospora]WPJ61364.1 hypothetical protein SMAC4_01670 [Sordaria macrospora]CCC08120.1 unnamed protein product [Sordaria macrospora k-hell]
MSQQNPSTPIYPLGVFPEKTQEFFVQATKASDLEVEQAMVKDAQTPVYPPRLASLFGKMKNKDMQKYAEWWAKMQDKDKNGPPVPASTVEKAAEQIHTATDAIIYSWDTDLAPDWTKKEVEARPLSGISECDGSGDQKVD